MAANAVSMPKQKYSLAWNPNPPITAGQIAAVAVGAGVYVILSWVGVIALPTGFFSVSALFVAVGFGIPFALWFGGWGFFNRVPGRISWIRATYRDANSGCHPLWVCGLLSIWDPSPGASITRASVRT